MELLSLTKKIKLYFWNRRSKRILRQVSKHEKRLPWLGPRYDTECYKDFFEMLERLGSSPSARRYYSNYPLFSLKDNSYLDFYLSRSQTEFALAWQFGLKNHPWNEEKKSRELVVLKKYECPFFTDLNSDCDPNCSRLAFCDIARKKISERMKLLRHPCNEQCVYTFQRFDDLEPCPCCGGKADCNEYTEISPDGYCPMVGYFFCTKCGLRTQTYFLEHEGSKEEQFHNWNMRIVRYDG